MAAQVEVQTGEVGRTVVGGRLHLSPLTDSSNSLIEINQSHIITPEPNKPVPGPKPRLTPKPFTVERNQTIKPIVAPKPQPKPRPESTRLPGYKPELPSGPKPQQPAGKPKLVSTNPNRPASTSYKTSNKLSTGQTTKPVAQPFKPAPPLDPGDPSKPSPPVPAERQKPAPSSLVYSKSLKKLPAAAAEWSGTTKREDEKDQVTSSKGGASITRAKSLGFLAQLSQEEEEKSKPEAAAVPLRPQPRGSRPRPVSAIFLDSPTKTETPVPATRWAGRRPLSADLTSKFESIGLSLHRKTPKVDMKENTPEEKKKESEKMPKSATPHSSDGVTKPVVSDQSSKKTEDMAVKETGEDKRSVSIKSRISLLLDSSTPTTTGSDLHSPVQPVPEAEPAVGVKQLIKQLTEDTTPTQSPVLKPPLKPRPLPLDLTKRFSSERSSDIGSVSVSEATDHHDISKDPQRRSEESAFSPSDQRTLVDVKDSQEPKKASTPEGPEAGQMFGTTSKESAPSGDVQTVRASLFDNVVERHSVLMVDESKPDKSKDSLSSPSFRRGTSEDDEGTLVTATYREPMSPSSPLRVLHAFDMVQAVEESRAVSENIPSAQREDKAMTLRSRRSEGSRTASAQSEPEQQPRYLRVGALQKWNTTGLEQGASTEKGMLRESRREDQVAFDKDREQEAAAPKRLKMLQAEEQPKPRATYFALTGQIQEPVSPVDAGVSSGDSQGKTPPVRRNPSLEEAFGKTSHDQVEELLMRSHMSHGEIRSALDRQTTEKTKLKELEREKQRQLDMEREAHLEFERMKEREMQREFERQRQRAFEKEKQEFEEKQRALERQKQMELEKQKFQELERERLEKERQRQLEKEKRRELERQRKTEKEKQERERQREQERQRQREEERQRELDKERQLLEIQKEKQIMEELERIKEMERQQLLEFQRQKQKEKERQQVLEMEKQRLREKKEREEAEKLKQIAVEQEMLRLKEKERQQLLEMEKQRLREKKEREEAEKLKQMAVEQEMLRLKEKERQQLLEMEKQRLREKKEREEAEKLKQMAVEQEMLRLKEKERQQLLEMEKQRLREKKEREEAEKLRQMAVEQEMLRLKELEKERERQKEMEKERQKEIEKEKQKELERQRQRDLERERQRQLDLERQELENQRLRQREQEKERQRKEELERIKEMERQRQREAEKQQILELEKRRLREKMEREEAEKIRQIAKQQEAERQRLKEKQKKEEQERARMETSPLRPKVVDLDAVLRNDPFSKATPPRSDPSTRWKEPSPRAEESYKLAILDIDSFTSQAQPSPSKDLFPVSGLQGVDTGFGARSQLTPERDVSWKVPPQNSGGVTAPVWTTSPQDPWELRPVEMSVDKPEPRKHANRVSPEQLLLRQEERLLAPQRPRSAVLDERLHLGLFSGGASDRAAAEQIWVPREPQDSRGDVRSHRRSHGSQELNRMRSRSVSRRSAPSSSAVEGSLSRMRSRSAHREQDRHSWVQQKQSTSGEEEGRDAETPVRDTDSQYGTWETGLRTDDSLTPATPSSESNLSPSPRKPTPPHTPGDAASRDTDTVDSLQPSSSSEIQTLSFPDAPATLLDTSALRSRAQLAKKRAPRTRPSRAARQSAALAEGGSTEDWLYRDSTEPKVESKADESDPEEQVRGADSGPAVSSQPQRIALFPGMDPSALKAQLKKRGDSDNQIDGPAPSPSQLSHSPKSPFLPRAARVLPPPGGKENGEEDSPQWLKELKSKKRLSHYENES